MFDQDLTNLAFQFQKEGLISAEISGRPPRLLARGKCPRCGQTFDINMPMSIVAVGHLGLGLGKRRRLLESAPSTSRYITQSVICNARLEVEGTTTECGACFKLYAKRPEG